MESRDLQYLLEIAATTHLGRAAERLGLTQPALTKCIARLERELEVSLLKRGATGVELTAYGAHLARHAERLRAADADVKREIRELATGQAGHIRIGTGLVAAQHILPLACLQLLKDYPGITFEINSGNSENLFPALRNGKVDVVLAGISSQPAPGFHQVFLMEDSISVIARRGHRLQHMRKVSAAALAQEQWIAPAIGTLPDDWLAQRWRDLGISPPKVVMRTGTLPTLLAVVAASDLLAFQSWAAVRRTNDFGRSLQPVRAERFTWRHAIGATVREGGFAAPAIQRLISALAHHAAECPLPSIS